MNDTASTFKVHQGESPLVVSVPHAGTGVPPEARSGMRSEALFLPDTDWFVDKLYQGVPAAGGSLLVTPWSRYVIDLNRPPDDAPLYKNHAGSSLVPVATFAGDDIYQPGQFPDEAEVRARTEHYWQPYHAHLSGLLEAARERHGYAILLDGHSIRSEVPGLFDGELPHLNLGTNDGASASPSLSRRVFEYLENSRFSAVRDQRFKGGYITRHYGQPEKGVHALQLEIAQRAYMPESPPQWDKARAEPLLGVVEGLVRLLMGWQPGEDD